MESVSSYINNNKIIIVCVLIFIIIVCVAMYIYINSSPKLTELYKPNEEKVPVWANPNTNNEVELLFFFATWCPYCRTAKPEWEKVKEEYQNKKINGYKILFVEVDCTHPDAKTNGMMDTYNVEGFPTVKLFKNGEIITFDAKVTSSHLTDFLNTAV
jgi:thiol-disulfide isomerase/thioredoxin